MARPSKSEDEKFSKAEAQARFEAALRGGLSTPPKPLKSMTPKRRKVQRRRKAIAPKSV